MTRLLLPALLLGLAGCATSREAQVRSALTDAGLPPSVAACMAEPMARDLSGRQLQSLARVARSLSGRGAKLTEGQILDLLRRDLDPETVGVVVRAGLGCVLRG
ncbi:MAG: hypothetical protein ACK4Z0_09560 [Sphingomonadaceae bacterium]